MFIQLLTAQDSKLSEASVSRCSSQEDVQVSIQKDNQKRCEFFRRFNYDSNEKIGSVSYYIVILFKFNYRDALLMSIDAADSTQWLLLNQLKWHPRAIRFLPIHRRLLSVTSSSSSRSAILVTLECSGRLSTKQKYSSELTSLKSISSLASSRTH